jgi:hypothetical protein
MVVPSVYVDALMLCIVRAETFCLERRYRMADVSARRREGLGEMGRLDRAWSFEENCREDQGFHESEIIGGESFRRYPVEVQCRTFHREHGTLAKEGLNAHHRKNLVYPINHVNTPGRAGGLIM